MISTTRKLPRKSAPAARAAPFARILSGRISGGYCSMISGALSWFCGDAQLDYFGVLTTQTHAIQPQVKHASKANTKNTAPMPGPVPPSSTHTASKTRTRHMPNAIVIKSGRRPTRSIVYQVKKEARKYQTCRKQPMSNASSEPNPRLCLKSVGA